MLELPAAAVLLLAMTRSGPPPATWPIAPPSISRGFAPPSEEWLSGHRGIDLDAASGASVRAMATGIVTFVGTIAGTSVVTLDHGRIRSTYQPVSASVQVGDWVLRGEPIGTIAPDGGHCAGRCLHLGVLVGDAYLNPIPIIRGAAVLKPRPHLAAALAGGPA